MKGRRKTGLTLLYLFTTLLAACSPKVNADDYLAKRTPAERTAFEAVAKENPRISRDDLAFVEKSLIDTKQGYADEGFKTYLEWHLEVSVKDRDDYFRVGVMPGAIRKVNAMWSVAVYKSSGKVEELMVGTLATPTDPKTKRTITTSP